jgi:hypothetical protein
VRQRHGELGKGHQTGAGLDWVRCQLARLPNQKSGYCQRSSFPPAKHSLAPRRPRIPADCTHSLRIFEPFFTRLVMVPPPRSCVRKSVTISPTKCH